MLDTGAQASIVKKSVLRSEQLIDDETIEITGVTGGSIHSIGTVNLILDFPNFRITHIFVVVEDSFPIETDMLLGMDFMNIFKFN